MRAPTATGSIGLEVAGMLNDRTTDDTVEACDTQSGMVGMRGVGHRFVEALGARDFSRLASCLAEDVRFRALLPRGLRELSGVNASVSCFEAWFGAADRVELVDKMVSAIADRQHLAWRLRVHDAGGVRLIEQQVYATVVDGRVAVLDLLCSGFRPV
jgi:hypothetical protein